MSLILCVYYTFNHYFRLYSLGRLKTITLKHYAMLIVHSLVNLIFTVFRLHHQAMLNARPIPSSFV
jgi:hypothetical protein